MTTGLSEDLRLINDSRKTATINDELRRLSMDIVSLQETRLAGSGSLKEKDYTFYWQGKSHDERREYGVGFAVRNRLVRSVELGVDGTERLMTLRLNTSQGFANLISAYAPTLMATAESKDMFYDALEKTVHDIPNHEQLILLGDFNARVGADHSSWPSCLGHHGTGKLNENGQRLLEFCTYNNLCITNTYFASKPQHRVSWRHPRSKHWHQLDLIITRRSSLRDVLLTRTYHSADCDTDHSLVCCKIRLQPKMIHHSKNKGQPRIDICSARVPEKLEQFKRSLTSALEDIPSSNTASENWDHLSEAIQCSASLSFDKTTTKSSDWFEANSTTMLPVIEAKRLALIEYKHSPSQQNLQALRTARSRTQQTARQCANNYWCQLSAEIQHAADTGNIKLMYDGIKRAIGPTQSKTAPLKAMDGEVLTDKSQQMERWVEHYTNLYSTENNVTEAALEASELLQPRFDLDTMPTIEELGVAIDRLPTGKAPGSDGIPADIIKCSKDILLQPLYNLLCQCWNEGAVPQVMRDAKIVTLYKNKGDKSDCNNYRGISLLSSVGKLFARIVLSRLQKLAERIYPESQCGFRANRSTIDMIFSVRQIQEKCREQGRPLYMAFIDLTKAFDLVSRDGLFRLLTRIGCPPKLHSIIVSFHQDMKGTVSYDGNTSESFKINSGVKQGCVLAPTLFGIFFSLLLKHAFGTSTEGVYMHTRSDGGLFNLARLKAKTKVRHFVVRELLFADDAAVVAHSQEQLQILMDRFSDACNEFGLTISIKKTNVMSQGARNLPTVCIENCELEAVHNFTYLGSTMSDTLCLDSEIGRRIGKAMSTMSRLQARVWENKKLTTHTKMTVYHACVTSTLLYGSESWTTYAGQERRLNTFHLRNLRRILGIRWQDMVPNSRVLTMAGLPSIHSLLRQRRLRWLGHVSRMQEGRLPKDILFGQLSSGRRPIGRPQLRYKDVCKRDMVSLDIPPDNWEHAAQDRSRWRSSLHSKLREGERRLQDANDEKRHRRKQRLHSSVDSTTTLHTCVICGRQCRSRIGLHSHARRCRRTDSDPGANSMISND